MIILSDFSLDVYQVLFSVLFDHYVAKTITFKEQTKRGQLMDKTGCSGQKQEAGGGKERKWIVFWVSLSS